MKNVLIIGSGGREHALTWHLAKSPTVGHIFVAPGNPGTANEPNAENIAIKVTDIDALCRFAQHKQIDLTIVGPEIPLSLGIADHLQQVGIPCFGPSQKAAQLESSKTFCKSFLQRHAIPTASWQVFEQPDAAKDYVKQQGFPIVIKQDGLAAGKGVVIAQSQQEADQAIDQLLGDRYAVKRILIEDYLSGEEVSFIAMVGNRHIVPLATTQDHKKRDDGDVGPNTGGMGAYSPAPIITPERHDWIMQHIIQPTVRGMRAEGIPYCGFLYAGLMVSDKGIVVLEYNCRLGDPETQVLLSRLNGDLTTLCLQLLSDEPRITQEALTPLNWDTDTALGIVMASQGYPGTYTSGEIIQGLDASGEPSHKIFHAGTAMNDNGQVITAGGRVLCAVAQGRNIRIAQEKAYQLVKQIHWKHCYYRHDIGRLPPS